MRMDSRIGAAAVVVALSVGVALPGAAVAKHNHGLHCGKGHAKHARAIGKTCAKHHPKSTRAVGRHHRHGHPHDRDD
jgi:hypothetical protein